MLVPKEKQMFSKNKFWAGIFLSAITTIVAAQTDPIITQSTSTSTSTTNANSETTVKSPPPTAVAPSISSMNSDLCAVGVSGAAQTQILGIAIGTTFVDKNCERLKLSKSLYDMGMKVAAVATLCGDERVFEAMMNAGTPCPVEGKIGAEAKTIWEERRSPRKPETKPVAAADTTKDKWTCESYAGDDPLVRQRLGCR
jgi:hypothetical protein